MLTAAHHQLGGPILVVWDGLPAHVCAATRAFIDAHADWLLVYRFPAYAPELNSACGVVITDPHDSTGLMLQLGT